MPASTASMDGNKPFRPSQEFLDIFWTLSDGNDDQRNKGAIQLGSMIEALKETDERQQILKYCKERLIRGLSSSRKFARVGFSVALTRLLRQFRDSLETSDIWETIQDKLKVMKSDKKSKAEVSGIYLGRVFAHSATLKAGLLKQMSNKTLESIVDELMSISEKKSFLKPVCYKTLDEVVSKVSLDRFGELVWPRVRDVLKKGWDSSSLDTLALLISCREKFPDVVNKKFLKKHWGFPLLNEENDEKLMAIIMESTLQNKDFLMKTVLPNMMGSRDAVSVWKGIGEKLLTASDKKGEVKASRQQLGLVMAAHIVAETNNTQQMLDVILSPSLAKTIFRNIKKTDLCVAETSAVFAHIRSRLSSETEYVKQVVERVWRLESKLLGAQTNSGDLTGSNNLMALVDMMPIEDVEEYSEALMSLVKGTDKWNILVEAKKCWQQQTALRHLQHLACSQRFSTPALQQSVLALFLRLAFFHVDKKTKALPHCEVSANFEEDSSVRKLCETYFFKVLDQLSTLSTRGHQTKSSHTTEYIELLYFLGEYFQNLIKSDTIKPVKKWEDRVEEEWEKLFAFVTKIKQKTKKSTEARVSAFMLLFMFLGFHLLTEPKSALDLLQEVYICYEKACTPASKKRKALSPQEDSSDSQEEEEEPAWVEVVTEVLLNLLSLPSHLGRVVATMVFRSLGDHVTPQAIQLLAEVLIPKPGNKDDAGGVLVEEENPEEEEEDEDMSEDDNLVDDDVPDEESSEEDDNEEEEEKDDEMEADDEDENGEQVDEEFRKKVKEALGSAAGVSDEDGDNEEDDEEDLPDLSDSEMFKLDELLAEVFRQRKKAGSGKKGREEKKREMANFRARALDLVEVLVKGEHCGDFTLDILKTLLLLILKSNQLAHQGLSERAKSLLHQVKNKTKTLKDTVHTPQEQLEFFEELLELAHSVSDVSQVREVSLACHIVVTLCGSSPENQAKSKCLQLLKDKLMKAIHKKHSKLHISFFTSLIELESLWYQGLASDLIEALMDPQIKLHGKMISCSVLASLVKKRDQMREDDIKQQKKWMEAAVEAVSKTILSIEKNDVKVMLTKEVLALGLVLAARTDIFEQCPFDMKVKQHLMDIKPKLNTDLRRLANKTIACVERSQSQSKKKMQKKEKKRKISESEEQESTPKKRRKS